MRRLERTLAFRVSLVATAAGLGAVPILSSGGSEKSGGSGSGGSQSVGGSGTGGSQSLGGSGGTPSAGTGGELGRGGASGASGAPSNAGSGGGGNTGQGGTSGSAAGGASSGSGGRGASGESAGGRAEGGRTSQGGTGGGAAGANAGGGSSGSGGSGGQSATAPSCATSGPGLTTCGKNGDESCCVSPRVEGGSFFRTYTNTGSGATGKADEATVSSFRLDKYEVTVGRFRQYVKYLSGSGSPPAAGSGKHAHLNAGKGLADSGKSGSFEPGWDASWNSKIPSGAGAASQWNTQLKCNTYATWTDNPGDNELLPLTCLNWWESHAFCIWDGGFLPSEAEWKYAAAGGDELRMYPWGSMNPGTDSQYAIYDCCYPAKQCRATSGMECPGIINAAPVGLATLGASRYGQLDLSGSVFEWLVDRYASYVNPCADCAYFTGSGSNRVLPGGGFRSSLTPLLQSANRTSISYAETFRGDFAVGVRCARSP